MVSLNFNKTLKFLIDLRNQSLNFTSQINCKKSLIFQVLNYQDENLTDKNRKKREGCQ